MSPLLLVFAAVVLLLVVATAVSLLRPRSKAISRIWDARHHTAMAALARQHAVPARGGTPQQREPEPVPEDGSG